MTPVFGGGRIEEFIQTLNYILSLQNRDGGFRRSVHGGISTLEDTYYAIASLNLLTKKLDVL